MVLMSDGSPNLTGSSCYYLPPDRACPSLDWVCTWVAVGRPHTTELQKRAGSVLCMYHACSRQSTTYVAGAQRSEGYTRLVSLRCHLTANQQRSRHERPTKRLSLPHAAWLGWGLLAPHTPDGAAATGPGLRERRAGVGGAIQQGDGAGADPGSA